MTMKLPITSNPSNQDTQVRIRLFGRFFFLSFFFFVLFCFSVSKSLHSISLQILNSSLLSHYSNFFFKKLFILQKSSMNSLVLSNVLLCICVLSVLRTPLSGYYIYQPWGLILKVSTL